jgi:hypothetical protein
MSRRTSLTVYSALFVAANLTAQNLPQSRGFVDPENNPLGNFGWSSRAADLDQDGF